MTKQPFSSVWSLRDTPTLNQRQFGQWQELLDQRFGIEISEQRKVYLETRLAMRMRELACEDNDKYYELMVSADSTSREWTILVDRLTVHETRLFRDPAAFRTVEHYIKSLLSTGELSKPLSIWSVGCSSGEEAYSLACTAADCLATTHQTGMFSIIASDISKPVLEKAQQAKFLARQVESLNEVVKQKYFIQQGPCYQVKVDLREKVHFTHLNALTPDVIAPCSMDIIFCQNLLIYFGRKRRQEIVEQLIQRLTPGGLLVLGISDMVRWTHHLLRPAYTSDVLAFTRRKDED